MGFFFGSKVDGFSKLESVVAPSERIWLQVLNLIGKVHGCPPAKRYSDNGIGKVHAIHIIVLIYRLESVFHYMKLHQRFKKKN